MIRLLSLTTAVTIVALAGPALACDKHESHATLTTVEAAPPAKTVIAEPVQVMPAATIAVEPEVNQPQSSKALGTAWENCNRNRKDQTVYYTQ